MRLYHFTSRHRLEPVLRHGLTLGLTSIVAGGEVTRIPGYQWLTRNPAFRQSWNEASLLPFDRTAYRIEIAMPLSARSQLLPWPLWRDELGWRMLPGFDRHGDPENWCLFKGVVPPAWFRHLLPNPHAAAGGGGGTTTAWTPRRPACCMPANGSSASTTSSAARRSTPTA